jgi:zinc protease
MSGGGSLKDIETLFQFIHLQFTRPRKDATVFGVMTDQMKGLLANRQAMPDTVFEELVESTMAQNHLRARPMSPEVIAEMNLDKSFAFYNDRFGDAGDFTFVFVGNIDLEAFKPLVTRYLASLPATNRRDVWRDVGITLPKGVITKTLTMGIEHKSRVRIVFSGPFHWSAADRVAFEALTMVLEGQLGLVLREEQSGTYGVQVESDTQRLPKPEYQISIDFSCAPERTEELVKLAMAEIAKLRFDGPSAKHVADTREAMLRTWETDSQQNSFVLRRIADSLQFGDNVKEFQDLPTLYRRLSVEILRDAARAYLDTGNYVRVTLLPEKK